MKSRPKSNSRAEAGGQRLEGLESGPGSRASCVNSKRECSLFIQNTRWQHTDHLMLKPPQNMKELTRSTEHRGSFVKATILRPEVSGVLPSHC